MAANSSEELKEGISFMNQSSVKNLKPMSVFTRLARVSAINSLSEVLDKVTTEITDLMEAAGCSIYLVPDVNPNFDKVLFRNGQETTFDPDAYDHIVVLAATTRIEMKSLVGKAFYRKGEGITGWVYEHKIPLNIRNMADPKELYMISSDLEWKDVYDGSRYYYGDAHPKPLLIVPLIFDDRQLGIIKFLAKPHHKNFSVLDEKLAILIAQIVSSAIHNSLELQNQNKTIRELITIGSKHDKQEVLAELTASVRDILRCEKSQVIIFNNDENSTIQLQAQNGVLFENGDVFHRGQGLIGWVYKTGKPLVISELNNFCSITFMTDDILKEVSDNCSINEIDRYVNCDKVLKNNHEQPVSFLAVPIKQDDEVLGVLAAYSRYGNSFRRSHSFSIPEDLNLAISFSKIVSNAIEYDQEKIQESLMVKLGYERNLDNLFSLVVSEIPKLVSSTGCSIFELKKGVNGPYLQMVETSRHGLAKQSDKFSAITYRLGEGKTGVCGLTKRTLIINHFGFGTVSEELMDDEIDRILENHPLDAVERLLNIEGMQVGIIQSRFGKKCPLDGLKAIQNLTHTQTLGEAGLPSRKLEAYYHKDVKPSWSFAAIPIQDEFELFGVITIARPVPANPFSHRDISVIESIAGRLAHVIGNIKMQEQRKVLLMSLAHEINTPLTAILADSENLRNEAENKELRRLADNNIEQVLKLQLMTETIMGALPGVSDDREGAEIVFEFVNIGELLHEARKLFSAEAAFKGNDILEPKSIGSSAFPDIEMSRFHLGIAIKNIVHNSVKYSYRPSKGMDKNRFINIWGIWADSTHQVYKINIQNYGVGISQEEIEKRLIFEPYYRGKKASDRRRTGAGFGLAHARQVIEDLHRGKIMVTSLPTGNEYAQKEDQPHVTTFTVFLPVFHDSFDVKNMRKEKL